MNKLPKHKDLDAELMPSFDFHSPVSLAARLGCLATLLIVVISWVALLGVMAAGLVTWTAWLFVALPIVLWLALLALPAFWSLRRGSLTILGAISKTAEAYLARAGYSIDLNNDGYIGHVQPVALNPPDIQVTRPIPWRTGEELKMLANEAQAIGDLEPAETEAPAPPPIRRRLWELPNGSKVEESLLKEFIDGIFTRGWSRSAWVDVGKLTREEHDGLIALIEQGGILTDRKKGFAGKLSVNTPGQAHRVLNLAKAAGLPADHQPKENDLIGRYEPI